MGQRSSSSSSSRQQVHPADDEDEKELTPADGPGYWGRPQWKEMHQKAAELPGFASEPRDAAPYLACLHSQFGTLPCYACRDHIWQNYANSLPITSKCVMNRSTRVTALFLLHNCVRRMLGAQPMNVASVEAMYGVSLDGLMIDEDARLQRLIQTGDGVAAAALRTKWASDGSLFLLTSAGVLDMTRPGHVLPSIHGE